LRGFTPAAFQRGNFWQFVGAAADHALLSPQPAAPATITLPATEALAIPANLFGGCGPLAVVDFDFMYHQIFKQLPASASVRSSQFPVFLF
jgi:hypothetical protein